MAMRHLQIEETFECHGKEVAVFQEFDVPQPYNPKNGPPPKGAETWAWAFTNSELFDGEIETIFLGFMSKDDACANAWDYRNSMLEDVD